MKSVRKLSHSKMLLVKLITAILGNRKRTVFLKKVNIFAGFGKNCMYCSRKIPEEPYMVKIHNNVVISANVNLITHDIINDMLSCKERVKPGEQFSEYYMDTIEIFDNVAIGSDSTILYGTKIGPNALIAAGSIVVKDVPEGSIVAGNPARVIGRLDSFIEKRKTEKNNPINRYDLDIIEKFYWKKNGKNNG